MKRLAIIIFWLVGTPVCAQDQAQQNGAFYVNMGFEKAHEQFKGLNWSANCIFNEKFSLQVGSSLLNRRASELPNDWNGGLNAMFVKPKDNRSIQFASIGYVVNFGAKHKARLNFSAGIARVVSTTKTNFKPCYFDLLNPNYTYSTTETSTMGIIINPRIEFPVSRGFGFAFSPYVVAAGKETTLGFSFNLMFGLLRGKY